MFGAYIWCACSKQSFLFPPYTAQAIGDVRLQDGSRSIYEGRVEVYQNGEWQSVCDDDWGIDDADVVCKQLNYGYAQSAPTSSFYGISFNNISEVSFACTGTESKLLDCPSSSVLFCSLAEEAGARCSGRGRGNSACTSYRCTWLYIYI